MTLAPVELDGETAGFMEVEQCGASPNAQYSTVQYSAQRSLSIEFP